jgi:hypothetical protein
MLNFKVQWFEWPVTPSGPMLRVEISATASYFYLKCVSSGNEGAKQ